MTTVFDYDTAAGLFGYGSAAELSSNKRRRVRRQPLKYRRFDHAADAIRFAIEEMPPDMLRSICLEADEMRFNGDEIRELYESSAYPLTRPATVAIS
jgi:hypothetical protein